MKPILKYPGAKWRLSPWIIEHLPPHESYLEPFFGSGAVLFNKTPSRIETINDLDGNVVHFFKTCRDHPKELARVVSLTPWSREEYEHSDFWTDTEIDSIERARRFAVRCWMSFGGAAYLPNGWRHTTVSAKNGGPDNAKLWGRVPKVIKQVAVRLMQVQIENRPALDVIRAFSGSEILIYADPPYMRNTRTANHDQYNHEMSDGDHVELLEALIRHPGPVVLSGYDCELYNAFLSRWRKVSINTQAERGARRTEVLWIKDRS